MYPRPLRRDGFTLFEILGAVTILAVVYSWLATSAMQGMRSEGLSKRRLEASLVIDQALMAMEIELATGTVPPVGTTEEEIDDVYRLVVEVTPFDPTPFLGEDYPPEGATSTLLLAPEQAEQAFLRVVDMRLRWDEGGEEHEVRRTTLVQDQAQIAALFPETEGADGAGATGSGEAPPATEGLDSQRVQESLRMLQDLIQ